MIQRNLEIREAAKAAGVKMWQLAEKFGVSEFTLCRWMRKEFSEVRKAEALSYISQIRDEMQEEKA